LGADVLAGLKCQNAPSSLAYSLRKPSERCQYWDEPICGTFVDPKDRQNRPAAWPDGNTTFEGWIKFKGSPWFICWDQDRQGIQLNAISFELRSVAPRIL
jgi:hypothetical protein